jgi:FtsH-binding integral membrane protein
LVPEFDSMSQMEDDAKDFLRRIVWSLSLGLLWLVTNIGIGAYNRLLVPERTVTAGNIIFYIWMVVSLTALIWINYRIWKKKFPHG